MSELELIASDGFMWLRFIATQALSVAMVILLFESTRRIVRWRGAASTWLACLAALLYFLGFGLMEMWGYRDADSFLRGIDSRALASETRTFDLDAIPAERRAESSRLLAKLHFDETGVLRTYRRDDGGSVLYAPSQAEIERWVSMQLSLAEARHHIENIRGKAFSLFLAALIALISGSVLGRRERRLTSTSPSAPFPARGG